MDEWVLAKYREAYCNDDGDLVAKRIDLGVFWEDLCSQRPEEVEKITSAVQVLGIYICGEICHDLDVDRHGRFIDAAAADQRLKDVREDLDDEKVRKTMLRLLEKQIALQFKRKERSRKSGAATTAQSLSRKSSSLSARNGTLHSSKEALDTGNESELFEWIRTEYMSRGFTASSFMGWKKFRDELVRQRPQRQQDITSAINYLRKPGHELSLEDPMVMQRTVSKARKQQAEIGTTKSQPINKTDDQPVVSQVNEHQPSPFGLGSSKFAFTVSPPSTAQPELSKSSSPAPARKIKPAVSISHRAKEGDSTKPEPLFPDSLLRGLQLMNTNESPLPTPVSSGASSATQGTSRTSTPDFTRYSQLLMNKKKNAKSGPMVEATKRDIEQAPLFSGSVVSQHAHDLVPQYGLLGCQDDQDVSDSASQIFLNTNVPMSTFICGVQGSGKSHTTACILENAVIPSVHLGQLEKPMSTLVFSYGEWSSGGAGFNISEATYLGAPSPAFPGHQVKRITVLTSPSNLAIQRIYLRHPNVRVIPFRLKAKTLDIGALRTLMAIDEKSSVPLYMAKVESILRSIAANSKDGSLDYTKFKKVLKHERFNPEQTNMLEMRLNLLESFLDMTDTAPQPDHLPGEITIIDLSDAFISPDTACVLFKLGLERFLQSDPRGKLVVLDEAHKYMLNTPGSKILTDHLTRVIRLQRHQGARVVVSTQEPTVSTDLIALCSVTIIHRFTSPAWYNALKKHISAMDDDQKIMHDIESLETGEALVYAPNAVLGKTEDGSLIKATGRLLKLSIRDRITLDGGESMMAV